MTYLKGKCLVAMPGFADDFFIDSLIYICSHNEDGAFGFVINKAMNDICFEDIAKDLAKVDMISLKQINVYQGGPLEKVRGFVLHSTDYLGSDSVVIDDGVAISSSIKIINDIALNKGPKNNIVALGYASWSKGQLEEEIKNNSWLVVDADDELLFATPDDKKWQKAFSKMGVNPAQISQTYGHA